MGLDFVGWVRVPAPVSDELIERMNTLFHSRAYWDLGLATEFGQKIFTRPFLSYPGADEHIVEINLRGERYYHEDYPRGACPSIVTVLEFARAHFPAGSEVFYVSDAQFEGFEAHGDDPWTGEDSVNLMQHYWTYGHSRSKEDE